MTVVYIGTFLLQLSMIKKPKSTIYFIPYIDIYSYKDYIPCYE